MDSASYRAESLDPEISAALAASPVNMESLDLSNLASVREGFPKSPGPAPAGIVREVFEVRHDPSLMLHVHAPRSKKPGRGCVFWMHGGGFVMGTSASTARLLDRWASMLDCVVVSVEYRLAPEHPYPAAIDDCYTGLRWVIKHGELLGICPGKVGVAGASAGGGLAAGLALMSRDRGHPPLSFQVLLYPMIDDRVSRIRSQWSDDPVWPSSANALCWRAYLGGIPDDEVPPYAAPARAEQLGDLPSALVIVGTLDGFFDDAVGYSQQLVHAEVGTDLRVYSGTPHGFMSVASNTRISERAEELVEGWLGERLQP